MQHLFGSGMSESGINEAHRSFHFIFPFLKIKIAIQIVTMISKAPQGSKMFHFHTAIWHLVLRTPVFHIFPANATRVLR